MRVPPIVKPAAKEAAKSTVRRSRDGLGHDEQQLERRISPLVAPASPFNFGSIGLHPAGSGAVPAIGDLRDPLERAADCAAAEVMSMGEPGVAVPRSNVGSERSTGEPLDASTRAFFEPRFGFDFGSVRVHRDAAAMASATRIGARAYTLGRDVVYGPGAGPGANSLTAHELAHVVQAGHEAMPPVVRRQPRPDAPRFKIVSQIWRVSGRDIVIVEMDNGVRRAFYRRAGTGNKGVGRAPPPGGWAPFKGLGAHPKNPAKPWLIKTSYYTSVHPDNPLRGYGNTLNREVAGWLDDQYITRGQNKPWQVVEQEMDDVIRRPSLAPVSPPAVSVSGEIGGKPGGGGTSSAPSTAKAESSAAKVESTAVKVESTAGKIEAKALAAQGGAVELAGAAAKGGRLARLGNFLLMAALPGPFDVLFLYIGFFGSIAEAKAKLRQEFFALGFAEGIGASLLGIPRSDAMGMLVKPGGQPGIGERVAGFEGVRDRATASGAIQGFNFATKLNQDQRLAFLKEGVRVIAQKGHTIGPNFNLDDVVEMGIALKPLVVDLLELAHEQEQERRKQEMLEGMYNDPAPVWPK